MRLYPSLIPILLSLSSLMGCHGEPGDPTDPTTCTSLDAYPFAADTQTAPIQSELAIALDPSGNAVIPYAITETINVGIDSVVRYNLKLKQSQEAGWASRDVGSVYSLNGSFNVVNDGERWHVFAPAASSASTGAHLFVFSEMSDGNFSAPLQVGPSDYVRMDSPRASSRAPDGQVAAAVTGRDASDTTTSVYLVEKDAGASVWTHTPVLNGSNPIQSQALALVHAPDSTPWLFYGGVIYGAFDSTPVGLWVAHRSGATWDHKNLVPNSNTVGSVSAQPFEIEGRSKIVLTWTELYSYGNPASFLRVRGAVLDLADFSLSTPQTLIEEVPLSTSSSEIERLLSAVSGFTSTKRGLLSVYQASTKRLWTSTFDGALFGALSAFRPAEPIAAPAVPFVDGCDRLGLLFRTGENADPYSSGVEIASF